MSLSALLQNGQTHQASCRHMDVCFQASKLVNMLVLLKLITEQVIKFAAECNVIE